MSASSRDSHEPSESWKVTLFYPRLLKRRSEKLRWYAQTFFVPKMADHRFISLPSSLTFLYYVLRPLRLTCKWSWRFEDGFRATARQEVVALWAAGSSAGEGTGDGSDEIKRILWAREALGKIFHQFARDGVERHAPFHQRQDAAMNQAIFVELGLKWGCGCRSSGRERSEPKKVDWRNGGLGPLDEFLLTSCVSQRQT